MTPGTKKIIKNILGWLIAIFIFYILFKTIYKHRDELANWKWRIDWFNAAVSFVTLMFAYVTGSLAWRTLIAGFGIKLRLHESFRVIYLANLGRYVPGKVWQVVGMVGLAKEVNVPTPVALASFALIQIYALPAVFGIIPVTLQMGNLPDSMTVMLDILYIFMAAVIVIFLVLFFRPGSLNWALNKILKLLKKEPVQYNPTLKNRIQILTLYIITWALLGTSFHFFIIALLSESQIPLIFSAGTYITAYTFGYVALVAPAGLGVREGMMSALLATRLGGPVAASMAIINRVWITLIELIVTLLALWTYKIKK